MKVEVTDLGPVKKSLAVELEEAEVKQVREETTRKYAKQARIPGFRSGKAPKAVIEARFGKEIAEEVRDRLVATYHDKAVKQEKLNPLGDPALDEVVNEPDKPFSFKTSFEILPEVELKEYKGLEAKRPGAEVEESDLEKPLEEIRQAHATMKDAEDRPARTGDIIVGDIEGAPEGAEPFNRENAMVEIGATDNLPQFNEQLDGARAGDTLEFSVDYPKEFHAEQMAGKSVAYKIRVKEVKERIVPELDDEFAKDLGEFENLQQLKDRIREDLLKRKESEADASVRRDLLDKLLLDHPVALPDVMVQEEVRHRMEDLVRTMMMQGLNPEQMELDWKEIRSKQEEPAKKTVHARLILDAVAKVEEIEVETSEIDEKIRFEAEKASEDYKKLRTRLKDSGGYKALQNQLVREKALDFITSVANIQHEV